MRKFLHQTPEWIKALYPDFIWQVETKEKALFLTFDDGPIPVITESILEKLEDFDAKATFFCVGENILKYPAIAGQVAAEGHLLANHTQHHLKGWEVSKTTYLRDVLYCQEQLAAHGVSDHFFRPPYGRIKKVQATALSGRFKIVMWNRLSWDFDPRLNQQQALKYLMGAPSGSIFVFHDNLKAAQNVNVLLPEVLSFYTDQGYQFKTLACL